MAGIGPMAHVPVQMTVKGLENQIARHWCLASYLILNVNIRELVELAERELPADFAKQMAGLVHAYMFDKKMPPAEIAQTVLNVSEDLAAGRKVELRAGDYIAAQNYFRATR
jgi:predicted transglutaminase-like protease